MAKRKRASLKDKSAETLGLSPKKGKGMDLLFGGPLEKEPDTPSESTHKAENDAENIDGLVMDIDPSAVPPPPPPVAAPPLPDDFGGRAVDELGLPVALEAPPDDLILASSSVEPVASGGEQDAVDPATSPFAMPAPVSGASTAFPEDANDLSGIVEEAEPEGNAPAPAVEDRPTEEEISPKVEEKTLANSEKETDLSGLVKDDDLSGLVAAAAPSTSPSGGPSPPEPVIVPATDPVNDLSGIMGGDEDLVGLTMEAPAAPPPTTAAPINVAPPAYSAAPTAPAAPIDPAPYIPPAAPNIPPPSTATGAPSLSPPRPAPIEMEALSGNVVRTLGALGQALPDSPEEFLKDDLPDHQLTVRPMAEVEKDDAITQQVLEYIGDRRDQLFDEIQELHTEVEEHLSSNKEDLNFALTTLLEANDIIIENPRQYDEAMYRVSLVKAMLVRRQRLTFWSYRMGLGILLYALFFIGLCIGGMFAPINFNSLLRGEELGSIFEAILITGLAGGIGGSVEILWRLFWRVSVKQDFDPQYLMYYLVKPILGFVLGMVMYFVVAVGTSVTGVGAVQTLPTASATTGFVLTWLLGFIAGFRQESVFDMIYVLIKKIAPEAGKTGVKSVKPVDELESPLPPPA